MYWCIVKALILSILGSNLAVFWIHQQQKDLSCTLSVKFFVNTVSITMDVQLLMYSEDSFGCHTSNSPTSYHQKGFCEIVWRLFTQSSFLLFLSYITQLYFWSALDKVLWIFKLIYKHLGNFFCKCLDKLCWCLIFSPVDKNNSQHIKSVVIIVIFPPDIAFSLRCTENYKYSSIEGSSLAKSPKMLTTKASSMNFEPSVTMI